MEVFERIVKKLLVDYWKRQAECGPFDCCKMFCNDAVDMLVEEEDDKGIHFM